MATTWTPTTWADQLLEDVNAENPSAPPVPIDGTTVGDVLHWMPAEEPITDWYDRNNPLNASLGTSSVDGTGSYSDLGTGASYTAAMINQSNMAPIRQALVDDATPTEFAKAAISTPWASGHYGYDPANIATTAPGGGPAPASAGSSSTVQVVAGLTGTGAGASATTTGLLTIFDGKAEIDAIEHFGATAMLVVAGLGIIGLGLYKLASPDKTIGQRLEGSGQGGASAGSAGASAVSDAPELAAAA
ncbi:MAG TPA: hypothetical protein VHW47_07875 [Acidimicrobiales bacterium]|jgi:hypothetical protein|nr:hypothetical protein [Acidimicrobiales bacterium]